MNYYRDFNVKINIYSNIFYFTVCYTKFFDGVIVLQFNYFLALL